MTDNTSKIHLAVESSGLAIEFTVTSSEIHDIKEKSLELVAQLPASSCRSMLRL